MRDKHIKELFEQEVDIPDSVREKMNEAYWRLGADMDKIQSSSHQNNTRRVRMRYVRAASFALLALMVTTTVHAASGGGLSKLTGLFRGDVKQIQSSSVTPEVSSKKSTFKNLDISVEQVLGTEELSYVVLKVKRTDGKTFDKNMDYHFKSVGMKGKNDIDWQAGNEENGSGSPYVSGSLYVIGGEKNPKVESEVHRYIDSGIMIKNDGTDEIYLAVVCGYEQMIDGKTSYHKGEKCKLKLSGLCGGVNGVESSCIQGTAEADFVLDYGECPKIVTKPGKNIRFPKLNSESEYLSAGRLDKVTVTPYFIQYERTVSEKQENNETWDQVYLEMEDKTRIGYPTFKSWFDQKGSRGGYGIGTNGKDKYTQLFPELIDVEHVKAVYFGKTRIEL